MKSYSTFWIIIQISLAQTKIFTMICHLTFHYLIWTCFVRQFKEQKTIISTHCILMCVKYQLIITFGLKTCLKFSLKLRFKIFIFNYPLLKENIMNIWYFVKIQNNRVYPFQSVQCMFSWTSVNIYMALILSKPSIYKEN